MVDILFINPGDLKNVYQDLGSELSAIEPPFLTASIASFIRNQGYKVAILDLQAENITLQETLKKVHTLLPTVICCLVYGNQPSASTQNMVSAGEICSFLKGNGFKNIVIGGLHPSALPHQTLTEEAVDFVIEGEEQMTLLGLLNAVMKDGDISKVPGLWWWSNGRILNSPKEKIAQSLDTLYPVASWDLLPMDKYRAHNWHCFDDISHRKPYAAVYTSLGCPFNCVFCCINIPYGKPGIRYRNPKLVIQEIDILVKKYGVRNLKLIDEMFVLDEKHYMKIVDLLLERCYDLNIWCYARVDTVKADHLLKMKRAGINWLALGIESANSDVRDGASKRMRVNDIKEVVRKIQGVGINVIGNYIFGLPGDTIETMHETLDMAIDINCEYANLYCAMAYPGSKLYTLAVENNWPLPGNWSGYSQHSYDILPLPTETLSAQEVLKFRDDAFHKYFENLNYLTMIESKFGKSVKKHMDELTKTRLKRKILGN